MILLYAVRNHEGKYFRAKGYGGGGDSWVSELSKAKIYAKIGQARSRVTYFNNLGTDLPAPQLVELKCVENRVIDESERVIKAKQKKETEIATRKAQHAKWELDDAQRKMKEAQATIDRLKAKK